MSHSESGRARISELSRAADQLSLSAKDAGQLFGVVDALTHSSALRRALSDPGSADEQKVGIVQRLFGSQTSESAQRLVSEAVTLRWSSSGALLNALEHQAVRAELRSAQDSGQLDEVLDELFRTSRIAEASADLREALGSRMIAVGPRQDLIEKLLADRADPVTITLARRAVGSRERGFVATLEQYLRIAAELRDRRVAIVTVANALTEEQSARLSAALTKLAGGDVDLQVHIDPDVLGGVRVEIGDVQIEGTVAGRLEELRRSLS